MKSIIKDFKAEENVFFKDEGKMDVVSAED